MARPPRIDFPDALYHVTSRGNGRQVIFWNDDDRERFLGQLADNLRVAGAVLYAYVLMDNHFHLLIRTPRANLSRFMQRLLTAYALYARYKHRRPGHQLQGRFKAKLVEDETYLLAVTRYIHLNPIKIAACRRLARAERLRRLNAYRWSSYGGYAEAKLAQEFVCYDVLKEYSSNLAIGRRQYRAYTHACVLEDDTPIVEAMSASRYAIGTPSFVERTEQTIELQRVGRLQDKDLELPRWAVPLEEINAAVARRYRLKEEQLRAHGHAAGPAKAVAVELACRLSGMTQRAIGAHYGGIGAAAVSTIHRKVQRADHEARAAIDALLPQLVAARRRRSRCH
jgi:REP element-mobilizing transposase RayT